MKSSLRLTSSTLGAIAGLLGMQHGLFEILQGNVAPAGRLIQAIGAPCQPETAWHACFPALALIPNMLVTGALALLAGLSVLVWAVAFVQHPHGGTVLLVLSLLMPLAGGGFVAALIGAIAALAGSRLHLPAGLWRLHSTRAPAVLARVWPWTLILMVAWLPGSWILGHFFGRAMLAAGPVLAFCFDLGLPLLAVLSAFAFEVQCPSAAGRRGSNTLLIFKER